MPPRHESEKYRKTPMPKENVLSQRIQDWILFYAISDTTFVQTIRDSVKLEYFNPVTIDYMRLCYQHFDRTARAPHVYFTELLEIFIASLPRPDRTPYKEYIERVFTDAVADQDDVLSRLADFVQVKALENGILTAAHMLDTGDTANAKHLLITAAESQFTATHNISRILSDAFVFEFDEGRFVSTTGFPLFDKKVIGWKRGQFVFYIAGTKVGKTWNLLYQARTAAKFGSTVLYITHEIDQHMAEERLFMMGGALVSSSHPNGMNVEIDGETYWRPSVCDHARVRNVQQVMRRKQYGEIFIKWYPYGSASKNDITACINYVENTFNTKIDVVVNDYADIMKLTSKNSERRHQLADIYQWHKQLAAERDILVITTSQTNRAAQEKEIVSIKDVAEDFQKAQIADAVIALGSTKGRNDEMRAILCLNRGEMQGLRCGIRKNYSIGQFMIRSWELPNDDDFTLDSPLEPHKEQDDTATPLLYGV